MRIGVERQGSSTLLVACRGPYRGPLSARCPLSRPTDVDAAAGLRAKQEQVALTVSRETGSALRYARGQILRTLDTIVLSAAEAIRIESEHVPLELSAREAGKNAVLSPSPVRVVAVITPFNAPVNVAAHSGTPALAAGIHGLIDIFVVAAHFLRRGFSPRFAR